MARTKQIAVRIPDELVEFLDTEVEADHVGSRADLVTRALRREQRRINAERDAAVYAASSNYDGLASLAKWSAHQSLDID